MNTLRKTTKIPALIILTMLLSLAAKASGKTKSADYTPQDYVWTTQSENSAGSMPCGGHDVGMNIWVEKGDILFYVSKSGMFDENNTLLKAGRFRLRLPKGTLDGAASRFCQRLCLDDGAVYISAQGVSVRIWADVYSPNIFVELKSDKRLNATLSYESWRYRERPVTKAECQQGSWKWLIPQDCVTRQDSIKPSASALRFWHKNRAETVFDFTVSREQLDEVKQQIPDPIGSVEFGGELSAPGFTFKGTTDGTYASTDYRSWNYEAVNLTKATISISLYSGKSEGTGSHLSPGNATPGTSRPTAKASRERSSRWWHQYWQRSYITAEGEARQMVRNYELFRYMLGCNAYGEWPSKFNGSLFTFDPVYADPKCPFTPDFRKWGGGTMTAQNQRLVYWPMLKSGDTDMMQAQFDTYLRMLPAATVRTKHYWGHDGASFSEQIENSGLPNPAEYGKHKEGDDPGMDRNAWLEYQWDTALEFCSMILQAHEYSGLDIQKYEPLIAGCVTFFDQHYQQLAKKLGVKALNADGKLMLYPSSGCETYKMAYNPASVVAALQTVVKQCIRYDNERNALSIKAGGDSVASIIDHSIANRIPDIPLTAEGNSTCIAPAIVWARVQNVETPQLYPVFPWRIYGIGRQNTVNILTTDSLNTEGIAVARNTYLNDPHALKMRSTTGWKQDNIWAACLGLTDEAFKLNREKLADGPYRFPAFWDPGYDWAPDCNKGGASMIGLQEMMLQETADGELIPFPSWPRNINAKFRLHASGGRTVEAELKDGEVKVKNEK